jgi:hypothetical protein
MLFKDWKQCDISQDFDLILDTEKTYYLHATAWHLKGLLGGTHSFIACYDKSRGVWFVAEVTDRETLDVQKCNAIYAGTMDYYERAPYITNRVYNARWFGHKVKIIDSCPAVDFSDILYATKSYPITEFNLLKANCNTFSSYLIWKLKLPFKRPIRSVGFKNTQWWNEHYGLKV